MADLRNAVALLREAAKVIEDETESLTRSSTTSAASTSSTSFTSSTPSTPSTPSTSTASEVRRLFSPYRQTVTPVRKRNIVNNKSSTGSSGSLWIHKFILLDSSCEDKVPDKGKRLQLVLAGLGEKKLYLERNTDPEYLKYQLLEKYPKLSQGGGYELLRSINRQCLEIIKPHKNGYTVNYLADSCALGQSIVYVRPMQRDLPIDPDIIEPTEECPSEICLQCGEEIPVICMKNHIKDIHEDNSQPKKRKSERICQYLQIE